MGGRLPVEEGYFAMPDAQHPRPRLIGSYSPRAQTWFFPHRKRCPVTFGPVEQVLLSDEGVLYSWTWIEAVRYGTFRGSMEPHGVGQVDLPEGVRVQTRLIGGRQDWRIGMPMVLDLVPVATDDAGNELCTYGFRARDGAGG